jgi:hypothetical protein
MAVERGLENPAVRDSEAVERHLLTIERYVRRERTRLAKVDGGAGAERFGAQKVSRDRKRFPAGNGLEGRAAR